MSRALLWGIVNFLEPGEVGCISEVASSRFRSEIGVLLSNWDLQELRLDFSIGTRISW